MKVKALFNFQYQTEEQAKIALKSLQPDNIGFLESYQDKDSVICILNGKSVRTILSTSDDLLFSEMVVEKTLELQEVLKTP